MVYDAECPRCGRIEVTKAMTAAWPRCGCGRALARRWSAPQVHFSAPGFYSTDVQRLKSQIGSERFARFEAQKDDVERRAKAGRLTDYEKAVEAASR